MSSPKAVKPLVSSSSSPLARKSSTDGRPSSTSSSAASQLTPNAASVKAGLKKLTVGGPDEGTITPVKTGGAPSPSNRSRLSPAVGSSATMSRPVGTATTPTASGARRASSGAGTVSSSLAAAGSSTTGSRITKAPVQSPTAAGMKMRPASGNGVAALSSIGVSAMAAAASSSTVASSASQSSPSGNPNPYSSSLSGSPIASAAPSSPIASASPNVRRYKTNTPGGPATSPQHSPAAASPIHSAPQSASSAAQSGTRKIAYDNAAIAAAGTGAASYRAAGVHPPVNTHAMPPPSHIADHPNSPGGGPTIFSPVYARTASQERLHQAEEAQRKAQIAAGQTAHGERLRREAEEARYQQEMAQARAAAQYAQEQAAAQAQAQAAAQQKHTVSYTPPPVEEDEFDPFMFIKHLPPLSPAMRNRRSPLPKKLLTAPKITLALDLDETLVHCSVQPIDRAELTFKVAFNGMDYEVYVRTRPHMKEFLETVSQWFEVIIFTASQRVYADKLLNIIDPQGRFIQHRVFRDSCVCVEGNYLKDLHILGRDLPTVAIVDNSVQAFGFQLDNGIPIESWFDDDNDRELLNLIPFLRTLKDVKDVRPLIRDTFRLSEFVASL